ncbi:restriction endonuclease subunit S [Clostridium perfringens]|uniref:Restriction endonuclease subunit S n=1 Tax=Clostridium perfringens TaxID=1502 RepID=A0AAW9IZ05_CLOPF|nr:restriction endonuclease subunit S [Clostridium perfringens]ELC8402786.1 restriction endonuclease subunit S [Clostridium perfringens]ELC8402910.1 restriction endonuclease subunit S [Clostridium perfringens]MBI5977144.1 restriction endonuclease subunit S [Clostridium perfringens]MBI5980524.1 restriction endonuclease subunit S [Clostridium perfringens]MBI5982768.1 restriction endonuclease subunit S [Clostridium perfringens]
MSFKETEVGRIPIDWEVDELSNKVDLVMGQSPKSEFYNDKGIGMPFMQGRTTFGEKYHYINTWCTDIKRVGIKNSVLMSVRAPVGDVNIATEDICIGRGLASLNMKNKNNEFLYYLLKNYSGLLISKESGTVFGSINKAGIEKLVLPFPSNSEQKAIAKILSDLDEKIEVNNKINKNLEEMAQAIFKQWFVDFEFPNEEGKPYKSSGGEMVESELGMIPKGFKIGFLRDYVDNILGGDWGKENEQGNYKKEVFCLRGADIPEVRIGKKGSLPKRYILEKNYNNKKLSSGDLVVEISGGSPTQSTGRISYINNDILLRYEIGLVCTNFCRAITLKNKKAMEYFYFCWDRIYNLGVFFQFENGTTGIKNLDVNTFLDKFKIVKPNIDLIEKFKGIVCDFNKTIQQNGIENERLEKLRDNLLPKLMSGEIRVPLEYSEN